MEAQDIGFEPLFARVLIERKIETKTTGGIIIPENSAKKNSRSEGVVLKVGPTCEEDIKALVGKKVTFSDYAGSWMELGDEGKEYYLINEDDLWGVSNGDDS